MYRQTFQVGINIFERFLYISSKISPNLFPVLAGVSLCLACKSGEYRPPLISEILAECDAESITPSQYNAIELKILVLFIIYYRNF